MTKSKPEFKIESGVPIPPRTYFGAARKYPWAALKINQSFFVPDATESMRCGMRNCAALRGIKITTRMVDGGLRVWRVK